jgi:hypothetical protein
MTALGPGIAVAPRPSLTWLADCVPVWLRRLVVGPVTRIRLGLDGGSFVGRRQRGRPVEIELDPDFVLTTRLSLPQEARGDLREAALLRIQSETPFEIGELLVRVSPEEGNSTSEDAQYRIDMAPRAQILDVLKSLRFAPNRVRSIVATAPTVADDAIRLPVRSGAAWWRQILMVLVPILLGIGGLVAGISAEASRLERQAMTIESGASELLLDLKSLQAELDGRRAALAGADALEALFDRSPSAFLTLNALKRGLPDGLVIEGLNLKDGTVQLNLRAPDILGTIKAMNAQPGWQASTIGGIASDPATNGEVATIALRITP